MADWLPTAISLLGVTASGLLAWYANLHRGKVKIARPTYIYFDCDSEGFGGQVPKKSVVMGTTISCTGKRGRIIEALSIIIIGAGKSWTFDRWCIEESGEVKPASGLPIPGDGINAHHYFYLQEDVDEIGLVPGEYEFEVSASVHGFKVPKSLHKITLSVPENPLLETRPLNYRARFYWRAHSPLYFTNVEALTTATRSLSGARERN